MSTEEKKETAPAAAPSEFDEQPDTESELEKGPTAEFTPLVTLKEVKTVTNEENEDVIFKMRAKLYRYAKETKEWKERGVGDAKLLKNKDTGMIRLLMRRDKILKLCLNQYVLPSVELKENPSSDAAWSWFCPCDYSDEEELVKDELFTIRFRTADDAKEFKKLYDEARENNRKIAEKKLSSEEKKEEEKKEEN